MEPLKIESEIEGALNNIDTLRLDVLERASLILQNQYLSKSYTSKLHGLIKNEHGSILETLKEIRGDKNKLTDDNLADLSCRCERLNETVSLLLQNWSRHGEESTLAVRELIQQFNFTSERLSETLVDRDLFDRQGKVLEQLIISHEHVSYWKEFVQQILLDFHGMFPFNFFFIAFAEENGLSLFVYYMGSCDEEVKRKVRERLSHQMLTNLNLPQESPLDIEEFVVLKEKMHVEPTEVEMLTVRVPEHAPKLAGLLGAAYALTKSLTSKEETVIRSILSVMVMVVGSSKVLHRTLSELEYYAVHDPLTGLHNRRHFNDMLAYEVDRSERHSHEFSIVFIDCDDFKDINDSYGHPCGDEVLIELGNIMGTIMRKGDLIARLGGDEFAILLPETSKEGSLIVAENVREGVKKKEFYSPGGKKFHFTISLGSITYPGDAKTLKDLMAGCDIALYKAKNSGKNSSIAFDGAEKISRARIERSDVEELRDALKNGLITPYFQPIIDCRTNEVFATEVVARLRKPDGEIVPAGVFIEAIERYGMARELDRIIIKNSFKAMREHMDMGRELKPVFINLSAQEIQGRGILEFAEMLREEMNIPAKMIVFELTEREAISDMSSMRNFLAKLQKKGFQFALDDFGSGYNSFHYLRELHFDFVKIDGEFVRSMLHSKIDKALVCNLSRLCQELDIQTIAEYVEDDKIYTLTQKADIDFAQGFHLGMPLPQLPE